jgi:hypothetical protein
MIDYDAAKGDIVGPILAFNNWRSELEYDERTPAERYAEQLINNQVRDNLNNILDMLENMKEDFPMEGWVREEFITAAKYWIVGGDE